VTGSGVPASHFTNTSKVTLRPWITRVAVGEALISKSNLVSGAGSVNVGLKVGLIVSVAEGTNVNDGLIVGSIVIAAILTREVGVNARKITIKTRAENHGFR